MCHDWPKPPIWPEDLPLIRDLLTDEEYAELLRRMVMSNGPLLDYKQAFGEQKTESPERRWDAQGFMHGPETVSAQRSVTVSQAPESPVPESPGHFRSP